jgi:FtsP/CotA-like multicopper oxidase with cupredoxin domain
MNDEGAIVPSNRTPTAPSSRRRFIASAFAAALGVSLAEVLDPAELAAAPQAPPSCSKAGDAFVPVHEFVSKNKLLNVNMTVKSAEKSIATIAGQGYQCRSMKVRYYEGHDLNGGGTWPTNPILPGPGPTLRIHPGDRVKVNLNNKINPAQFGKTSGGDFACNVESTFNPSTGGTTPLYPGSDTAPSCLHGNNLTNLHYHGTHVTPDGAGDNVMVDVEPISSKHPNGGTFVNDFTIPLPPPPSNATDFSQPLQMGQAPGTHWYHAHKHGSVALQLLNGMAGALIIDGEFDDQLEALMPGLRKTEKVLVIQQIGDNITVEPGPPIFTCASGDPLPLVNGQVQPTIQMQPGEIQRWRFVNATMQQVAHLTYRFLGEPEYAASKGGAFPSSPGYVPTIRQIAYDGVQLAPERYNDPNFGFNQEFTIAAGNRVDILVQAPPTPGQSVLAFRMLHTPPAGCPIRPSLPDLILVRLNVTGSPVSPAMNFPTAENYPQMPSWLQWNEGDPRNKLSKQRCLRFNSDATGRPAIDGLAYDGKPDTTQYISLNTAEEWILENYWDSSIHPFHIHVNPFQVLEVFDPNAATQVQLTPPYNWRDTIAIPPSKTVGTDITPGRIRIRSRFVDFPGTFVLHCHILDHEDRGMMQEVQILDPKAKAAPPLPMHH